MQTFNHDDNTNDFHKLIERAKVDPTSVSQKEIERAAEEHVRNLGDEVEKLGLEGLADIQTGGARFPRTEPHSYLFVSHPLVTEIWILELAQQEMNAFHNTVLVYGGEYALKGLLDPVVGRMVTPHKMLHQKHRQLLVGRKADGTIMMYLAWSDKKLPDDHEVRLKDTYTEGLHRKPVYHVPSRMAIRQHHT